MQWRTCLAKSVAGTRYCYTVKAVVGTIAGTTSTSACATPTAADTPNPLIYKLRDLLGVDELGGTMRLGAYECMLAAGSLARSVYGADTVHERHRHRWEFNNDYLSAIERAGLMASGKNPATGLVEIVELPGHPFFIGVQFHPELKSTVESPHPLFVRFIGAALENAERRAASKGAHARPQMI